jgi:hypothetical protein
MARCAVKNKLREALTVYRKGEGGLFVKVYAGAGPSYSAELNAWLHVRMAGPFARLRIALDAEGKELVPTESERAEAEAKKRAEAERRVRELEERLRNLERSRE